MNKEGWYRIGDTVEGLKSGDSQVLRSFKGTCSCGKPEGIIHTSNEHVYGDELKPIMHFQKVPTNDPFSTPASEDK